MHLSRRLAEFSRLNYCKVDSDCDVSTFSTQSLYISVTKSVHTLRDDVCAIMQARHHLLLP